MCSRHLKTKQNDGSPRDSAVEASRRRRRQQLRREEEEDGAIGSGFSSRGLTARSLSPFLEGGKTAGTPGAAVGDAGSASGMPARAALGGAADGFGRVAAAAERSLPATVGGPVAAGLGAAPAAGEVVGGGSGGVVSAQVAAVAATLAAADRDANYRFEADGLTSRNGARPLTRRELEGLKRRALAKKSLVASTSWVIKQRAAAAWRIYFAKNTHIVCSVLRARPGSFPPRSQHFFLSRSLAKQHQHAPPGAFARVCCMRTNA